MSSVINRQGRNYFPRKKVAKPEIKPNKKKYGNKTRSAWEAGGARITHKIKSLNHHFYVLNMKAIKND